MAQSTNFSPEALSELMERLVPLLTASVTAAIQAATPAATSTTTAAAQNAPRTIEPLIIPRPPATAPASKSTATCKPPKEPSLTGDKAQEWLEFEREFLRYFRITQSYYLEPEVQVDLLLATAGDKVRRIFYQLRLSEADSKNLEAVIKALRQVFGQQQSPFVNSYLFMKIRRESGEDLDNFVVRLKEAAKKCAFADEDRRVLEQLVFSTIDNVDVLKRIIKESPPTLEEMIRILKADEVAMREMDRMVSNEATVNAINQPKSRRPPQQWDSHKTDRQPTASRLQRGGDCANCIFSHNRDDNCPAKTMECFFCKKPGHMIGKCRKRASNSRGQPPKDDRQKRINAVAGESDSDSDSDAAIDKVFIASLDSRTDDRSWNTAIKIAGKKVICKIDTGAEVNVMPKRIYNQLSKKLKLKTTRTTLHTVAGQVKPIGTLQVPVQYKEKKAEATFFVVEDSTNTLCGLQTSVELGLVQKLFQ